MQLKQPTHMRVCTECGELAVWTIMFYWAGVNVNLCDPHYDALQCLLPKPTKQAKKPKRVVY